MRFDRLKTPKEERMMIYSVGIIGMNETWENGLDKCIHSAKRHSITKSTKYFWILRTMAFFMIYYTHSTYKIRARKTFVKNNNEHSIDNLGLFEITWEIFYRIKNLKIYFLV